LKKSGSGTGIKRIGAYLKERLNKLFLRMKKNRDNSSNMEGQQNMSYPMIETEDLSGLSAMEYILATESEEDFKWRLKSNYYSLRTKGYRHGKAKKIATEQTTDYTGKYKEKDYFDKDKGR